MIRKFLLVFAVSTPLVLLSGTEAFAEKKSRSSKATRSIASVMSKKSDGKSCRARGKNRKSENKPEASTSSPEVAPQGN